MAQIILNINKMQDIIDTMKWVRPIEDGYTENQWVKECIKRYIIETNMAYKKYLADISVQPDDSIIT